MDRNIHIEMDMGKEHMFTSILSGDVPEVRARSVQCQCFRHTVERGHHAAFAWMCIDGIMIVVCASSVPERACPLADRVTDSSPLLPQTLLLPSPQPISLVMSSNLKPTNLTPPS